MLSVNVRSDLKQAVARFEVKTKQTVDAAAARALNRTATTVRVEAGRKIRDRYNIKAAVIRRQMKIRRATRQNLYSEVVASGRPIPLIHFGARAKNPWNVKGRKRRKGGGVSVQVTRARKLIKGVFIAKMDSGHVGVFQRTGKRRTPVKELFSLSLPSAFTNKQVMSAVKRVAAQRFAIELNRELKFRTGNNG